MKYLYLSVKNVSQNLWRSLTLGIFIFLSVVIYILFYSVVDTATDSVNVALIDSLLGHVQIRPAEVEYKDIIDMSADWGSKEYLSGEQVNRIQETARENSNFVNSFGRVRTNALISPESDLTASGEATGAIIIGQEGNAKEYQNNLKLTEGDYLTGEEGQIILSNSIASQLQVSAGDTIYLQGTTIEEEPVMVEVTVAGIGNAQKLAGFEGKLCYTDIKTAQLLKGLKENEFSEYILYTPSQNSVNKELDYMEEELNSAAGNYTMTGWKEQGGYIGMINMAYGAIFFLFMFIILLITGILIMNLVMMIGYERRQEIATLRSIGFSKLKIVAIYISEILMAAVLFALLGMFAAFIAGNLLSGVVLEVTAPLDGLIGDRFQLNFSLIKGLPGVLGIMIFTALAAFRPSYKAASINPADILDEK